MELEPWIGAPEDVSPYVGFVYLITAPHGRMYVGKKLMSSKRKLKPLAGQKRARRVVKESDWRKYFGSSKDLLLDLEAMGPKGWRREILHLCRSKTAMSLLELREQIERGVLFTDAYYNGIIAVKLRKPSLLCRDSVLEDLK